MNKTSPKIILAIETSCDETAAAVLRFADDKRWPKVETLSSVVKSQIKLHNKFGGVVPEAAARAHVKNILPVVNRALSTGHCALSTIDYIAVTAGPGLIPSLIVGVEFAKGLSFALKIPIIPINHMLGHLYSPFGKLGNKEIKKLFPMISLIVSGGHTMLVLQKNIRDYRLLGETVDDAAGEAFDKVAKLLGLPYPGGPEVSRLAMKDSPSAINFPRPMINSKDYNFSFSGLKTAVLYYLRDHPVAARRGVPSNAGDICAAFQTAAVDVLVTKTLRAAKQYGARSISLSGGVAANLALREKLKVESKKLALSEAEGLKVSLFVPPMNLCTDNAEMIGLAASFMLHNGYKPKNFRQIKADPNLKL